MSGRRFLDSLFRDCSSGLVEVRATPSGQRAWTELGAWSDLHGFVTAAVNATQNVYVGLATRKDSSGGTAENLAELPMFFADIDAPPAQVRARLESLPFRPALFCGSGYGTAAFFRSREPLNVSTPEQLQHAGSLQRRLAAYLGADDRATSPAVAPRLVGTKNFKYDTPRPVTLLDETDATVNACELDNFLPAEVVRRNTMTVQSSIPIGQRNDQLFVLGRSLRARGLNFKAIDLAIRVVNAKVCAEPLDEKELLRLMKAVLNQPNRAGFVVHR